MWYIRDTVLSLLINSTVLIGIKNFARPVKNLVIPKKFRSLWVNDQRNSPKSTCKLPPYPKMNNWLIYYK